MDVALSVVGGLLVVLAVLAITVLSIDALGPLLVILDGTITFWFVGVAAAAASFVLGRQPEWRSLARVLGAVGVTWITFVIGFSLLLSVIFFLVPVVGY